MPRIIGGGFYCHTFPILSHLFRYIAFALRVSQKRDFHPEILSDHIHTTTTGSSFVTSDLPITTISF